MIKELLLVGRMIVGIMLVAGSQQLYGQNAYRLTLDEVVALAQSDAPDALLASTRWKRATVP